MTKNKLENEPREESVQPKVKGLTVVSRAQVEPEPSPSLGGRAPLCNEPALFTEGLRTRHFPPKWCFSKRGLWTSHSSSTQELVRNANSWPLRSSHGCLRATYHEGAGREPEEQPESGQGKQEGAVYRLSREKASMSTCSRLRRACQEKNPGVQGIS